MKKSPWIVFCMALSVAGLVGQVTAFGATTNAVYDITSASTFALGKVRVALTNAATAVFLDDGTCDLFTGSDHFTGTYTVSKSGKQVKLALDASGAAALKSNVVSLIEGHVPAGVSVSVKSVKAPKISLKNGVPSATDTVSGKLSETIGGKVKSKGFSLKTLWTDWVLVSGTGL